MIQVNKVMPNVCKEGSCLSVGVYEFTDYKDGETVTLAYSCNKHVKSVNKLLKNIYKENKNEKKE
jgi:hypothetical protein